MPDKQMDLSPTRLQFMERLKPPPNAWHPNKKDPKVVLITMPSPWLISDRDMPNLGVLYVAAYLKENGVNVQCVDLCGIPEKYWYVPDGDIYGISCVTPQWPLAKMIAKKLRDRQPDAYIVMGGYHPSALPDLTLETSEADTVVVGDGEYTFLKIVKDWPNRTLGKIQGEFVKEIDTLPWPLKNQIDIRAYHPIGTNAVANAKAADGSNQIREEYTIQSRGCPFTCGYCAQMLLSNRRVRYRAPDCIREEMTYLIDRYKVNRMYLFDDIFVVDKKRVYAFCDMVDEMWSEGYKFDWHCLARADIGDYDLYKRMADAHCKQVTFGLEHGDDRILKRCLKECTREQNLAAVRAAKKAGLRVRGQLIVGLPGENDESVENLATFIDECPADSLAAHIFVPLPGSPIYNQPERFDFGWHKGQDFLHYQTIGKPGEWKAHQLHLNSDDILRWTEYIRARIANRNVFHYDARFKAVIEPNEPAVESEVVPAC